ncbi:MAG: hypothetical protein Q7S40_21085 [Opitutaceae bacterium]|nr:hypothetical protein [Opitutaceae bacterium]
MKARPEITWSIMHPVKPDPGYMREVIAHAGRYHVDSFEICGEVHSSLGGLDGAIWFRDYPAASAALDTSRIQQNVTLLREIVSLAHASGRPVYYWHREVMVPRRVVENIPGLLDENGEFDLLGATYQRLVQAKIREFFENVPEMDGLVLTLTESDYSVIHNSDPRRYPPREVVKHVVGTFAAELHRRGKRFVLRSFGSIAQDYEDILAGAAEVPAEYPFEIETKITPYDFSPFLQFNPYLRKTGSSAVSAEYDSIGEFLGAGFLPAPDPARVIESVAYARAQGVARHVIRVDRIGHPTFTSTQAINLLAFDRAILEPGVTADEVWAEWASAYWRQCRDQMVALMQRGLEMVKATHFIDGHVIFHAFPIQPELRWIKACGILSLFQPGQTLAHHQGMWGILGDRKTPTREALLREKERAVALADEGLRAIRQFRDRLPETEYRVAEAAWRDAPIVTRAIRHWCLTVGAYFEDMEQGSADHPSLDAAIAGARHELAPTAPTTPAPGEGVKNAGGGHEYGAAEPLDDSIASAYIAPILEHLRLLVPEFEAEYRERARWRARPGIADFVVCGGFLDDVRVARYMHASHSGLIGGRPARLAGNRVFPNGFIEMSLAVPAGAGAQLVIEGDAGTGREFRLAIDGVSRTARVDERGEFRCELPSKASRRDAETVTVRIQKLGTDYPAIHGVGTVAVR